MSAKPRSSLKKRSGVPDDNRRVSFASPLSSDQKSSPTVEKQLPVATSSKVVKASRPVVKKSKPADELVDIISVVNQQSEVIEEISEMESKFAKQSTMIQNLTIDLANYIESIANISCDSTKVELQVDEQAAKLRNLETSVNDLICQATSVCVKYESRISAQALYSSYLLDLQKGFNATNCTRIDKLEDSHIDYDRLLAMVDKLESCIDKF